MNEEQIVVKVALGNGSLEDGTISVLQVDPCEIEFFSPTFPSSSFSGSDLFDALANLRRSLEASGTSLLCNGARIDVFPSGMSRSMGLGRKAYAMRLGRPALKTDLLDIFEYAEPDLVGTVQQQKEFHERWVSSLRKQK